MLASIWGVALCSGGCSGGKRIVCSLPAAACRLPPGGLGCPAVKRILELINIFCLRTPLINERAREREKGRREERRERRAMRRRERESDH